MRTENIAIPCRGRCPIGVIPSSPERQDSLLGEPPRGVPVYIKDEGTRTFSRPYVGTIRPPNPNQRRVAKTSGFPHPLYIQVHRAGVPPGENLGARGMKG